MIYNKLCLVGFGAMFVAAGAFYVVCAIDLGVMSQCPKPVISTLALANAFVSAGAGTVMFLRYFNVRDLY